MRYGKLFKEHRGGRLPTGHKEERALFSFTSGQKGRYDQGNRMAGGKPSERDPAGKEHQKSGATNPKRKPGEDDKTLRVLTVGNDKGRGPDLLKKNPKGIFL